MTDKPILSIAQRIEVRRAQLQTQYRDSQELIEPELKKYVKHLVRRGVKAPHNRKSQTMDPPMG